VKNDLKYTRKQTIYIAPKSMHESRRIAASEPIQGPSSMRIFFLLPSLQCNSSEGDTKHWSQLLAQPNTFIIRQWLLVEGYFFLYDSCPTQVGPVLFSACENSHTSTVGN